MEKIHRTSTSIFYSIATIGWSIFIEDDYSDLKDYVCTRDDGIAEAFTRMNLVVMSPDLDSTDADGLYLHFNFFADPEKLWEDKRAFGKYFRKDNCRLLQAACEEVLCAAQIEVSEPSVKVRSRPKNPLIKFDDGEAVSPAYCVVISYWIAAKGHE